MLTPKQERFCQEYLIDLNATRAAIRAGYSEKTANNQSSRLLVNVGIQNKIAELKSKLSKKTNITAEAVINELAKIAFANVQDYIEEGNLAKDFTKIKRKKAAAIASVKLTESSGKDWSTKVTEFKLHDKQAALEKLGRHLGVFEKDNLQSRIIVGIEAIKERYE